MDNAKRLTYVTSEIDKAKKRLDRMRAGAPERGRLARFIGSLEFARLSIVREIEQGEE